MDLMSFAENPGGWIAIGCGVMLIIGSIACRRLSSFYIGVMFIVFNGAIVTRQLVVNKQIQKENQCVAPSNSRSEQVR